MRKVFAVVLAAAGAASAMAQDRIPIGVDIGVFFPSNGTIRSTYGDSWFRVGLTPLSFQIPEKWSFTFDIGILQRKRNDDKVLLIPVTFGMTRAFTGDPSARPYAAVRIGPYWGDVDSVTLGVDRSRFGFNANAALGMTFENRFYIEGRFDYYSDFDGLKFSGFTIAAGVKLFEIKI